MTNEIIITPDSPDAATYRTDICGWVSRDGRFFGDTSGAEERARYAGATHRKCPNCGAIVVNCEWIICKSCRARADAERYQSRPRAQWDGIGPLYSDAMDYYFADLDEVDDYLAGGDGGRTIGDLRLVICKPVYASTVEMDYWLDDLAEDSDLPKQMQAALEAFNKAISGVLLSWEPGEYALELCGAGDDA